jgi:GTPase
MRLIKLPHGGSTILSDTVGFISDLPTTLISAFRATLEEVRTADVIVHVRDISHADSEAQSADVEAILDDLGVADRANRVIEAWNKVDLLDADSRAALASEQETRETAPLAISAATGEGIDHLLAAIEDRLARGRPELELLLDLSDGQGLHWLYEHAEVMSRHDEEGGVRLTVRVPPEQIERVKRRFAIERPVRRSGPSRVASR